MQEDNTPIVETEEAAWKLDEGQNLTMTSDEAVPLPDEDQEPDEPVENVEPEPAEEEPAQAEIEKAEETATPEEEQPTKKNRVPAKKRIAELTKKQRTAERERDQAVAKQKKLEAQLAEFQAAKGTTTDDAVLNEDDFENYEDFIAAKAKQEVKRELQQEREARLQEEKQRADQAVTEKSEQATKDADQVFREQLQRGYDNHDDFAEVAFNESVPVSEMMATVIRQLDDPAETLYALGSHPEEAARIQEMNNPIAQAAAMAQLVTQPAPKKQIPKTNTPDPIQPVKASAATRKNPSKMTPAEYRAWRESES